MITVQDMEQLHIIADTVLRKHGCNIELALPEFIHATADAGLTQDPRNIMPILAALEYAAREYLMACAKKTTE